MQLNPESFQSLNIDVSEKIVNLLLKNIPINRYNIQLNLFDLQNPLFCLYLLISKRLHVTRIHSIGDIFNSDILFGYWKGLGIEIQQVENLYNVPIESLSNPVTIFQVSAQSESEIAERFNQIPAGSAVVIIHCNNEQKAIDGIWNFMNQFWPHLNIIDYQFAQDEVSTAYLIYGNKR